MSRRGGSGPALLMNPLVRLLHTVMCGCAWSTARRLRRCVGQRLVIPVHAKRLAAHSQVHTKSRTEGRCVTTVSDFLHVGIPSICRFGSLSTTFHCRPRTQACMVRAVLAPLPRRIASLPSLLATKRFEPPPLYDKCEVGKLGETCAFSQAQILITTTEQNT